MDPTNTISFVQDEYNAKLLKFKENVYTQDGARGVVMRNKRKSVSVAKQVSKDDIRDAVSAISIVKEHMTEWADDKIPSMEEATRSSPGKKYDPEEVAGLVFLSQ